MTLDNKLGFPVMDSYSMKPASSSYGTWQDDDLSFGQIQYGERVQLYPNWTTEVSRDQSISRTARYRRQLQQAPRPPLDFVADSIPPPDVRYVSPASNYLSPPATPPKEPITASGLVYEHKCPNDVSTYGPRYTRTGMHATPGLEMTGSATDAYTVPEDAYAAHGYYSEQPPDTHIPTPTPTRTPPLLYRPPPPPANAHISTPTPARSPLLYPPPLPQSYSTLDVSARPASRLFSCLDPSCGRTFKTAHRLALHLTSAMHSSSVRAESAQFVCMEEGCGERFSRRHDRLRHERTKHGRRAPWTCSTCDGGFSFEWTLRKHVEEVHRA